MKIHPKLAKMHFVVSRPTQDQHTVFDKSKHYLIRICHTPSAPVKLVWVEKAENLPGLAKFV